MAASRIHQLLAALGDAADAVDAEEFGDAVLASVVAAVGAHTAVLTSIGPRGVQVTTWPDDFLTLGQQSTFEQINDTHPWPLATHTRAGHGRPLRISDLLSRREYHATVMYSELFRELGCEHQVAFSIPVGTHRQLCVAVNRAGGDFSAAELDDLDTLRRPLAVCAARVAHREELATGREKGEIRLSSRESDVLTLVASGLTSEQVGRRLAISARTVDKHLEHIYAKTGTSNRTEAAARWHAVRPAH